MSSTEMDLGASVCEKCGTGVHMDEDGAIACDGCNLAIERCECASKEG